MTAAEGNNFQICAHRQKKKKRKEKKIAWQVQGVSHSALETI